MKTRKWKLEDKIKKLNEIRAMHHRRFEEIERKYRSGEIAEKTFEKYKMRYEKKKDNIRRKIHRLEEKLSANR